MNRLFILNLLCMLFVYQSGWGQIPKTMSFQGVLTDANGTIVPDGNYNLTFKMYEVASGGTAIWSETQIVAISKGVFNAILGKVNPLNLPFDKQYWLGITIGTSSELTPRTELTSAPYSLNSSSSGGGFTLPYAGTVSTNNGFGFSITNTGTYNSHAISGKTQGFNSRGVYGLALGDSAIGVHGEATGGFGWGLYGKGFYGVYGEASGLGMPWAGYFKGNVKIKNPGLNKADLIIEPGEWNSAGDYGRICLGDTFHYIKGEHTKGLTFYDYNKFQFTGGNELSIDFGARGSIKANYTGSDGIGWFFNVPNGDTRHIFGYNYGLSISSNPNEFDQLLLRNNGNIGIGTQWPGGKLHVLVENNNTPGIFSINNTSNNNPALKGETNGIGPAVYGEASNFIGCGVQGTATGDAGKGVSGITTGDYGSVGVYGQATNTNTSVNYGGFFSAQGDAGVGVFAEGGPNGSAAVFDGNVKVMNGRTITPVLEITGGSDLSEQFGVHPHNENISPSPGMVVCIDPDHPGELMVSSQAYDRRVAGIISGAGGINPGMLMGQRGSEANGSNPVALTGRVYCQADASYGSIKSGDLLTTSEIPGHAMKVMDYNKAQGAIIGKAMSSLKNGRGLVLVLVSLQ